MDRSLDVIDRVELRQIRIFIAVGEELHFGRAAERLDMVQSAVSQTIRQLETELEVPLFERTSRRVRLTPAGEALLVAGQELLTSAARLRRGVREAVRGQTGYVRIAGVPAAWWSILPQVLRVMRTRYPTVGVLVHEMHTPHQVTALRDGAIDLGFVRLSRPVEGINTVVLAEEPVVVALPSDHRLCRQSVVELSALAAEDFIWFPRWIAPESFDQLTGACQRAGFSPHIAHECVTGHVQLGLISAGLGVALTGASSANVRPPGVEFRPVVDPEVTMSLAVAVATASESKFRDELLEAVAACVPHERAALVALQATGDAARQSPARAAHSVISSASPLQG